MRGSVIDKQGTTLIVSVFIGSVAASLLVAPAPSVGAATPRCAGKKATIVRTAGDQHVRGTPQSDVIVTGPGSDTIEGLGGADRICSGGSADRILGGRGAEKIVSGPGNDDVDGGLGTDRIDAGPGDDELLGDRGNDLLNGGKGSDKLDGELGDDSLYGGDGTDRLVGGLGNERLYGGPGDGDLIRGDRGNDLIDGGPGVHDTASYSLAQQRAGFRPSVLVGPPSLQPIAFPAPGTGGVAVDLSRGVAVGDGGDSENVTAIEDVIGSPFGDAIEGNEGPNIIDGSGGDDLLVSRPAVFGPYPGSVGPPTPGDIALGGFGDDQCVLFAETRSCLEASAGTTALATASVNESLDGSTVVVSAGDPADEITVARQGSGLIITDARGLAPREGCTSYSATEVSCRADRGIDSFLASTGAGDDRVEILDNVGPNVSVRVNGGEGNDTLLGGRGDDVLEPGDGFGYDILQGRGGNDALSTSFGLDHLDGGDGSDLLIDQDVCGGHVFDGGPGIDSVSFARTPIGVTARIGASVSADPCVREDRILSTVENIEGSPQNDVLSGDRGPNKLLGRNGDDVLRGDSGPDALVGGLGADSLFGESGTDSLFARDGAADPAVVCGPGPGPERVVADTNDSISGTCR